METPQSGLLSRFAPARAHKVRVPGASGALRQTEDPAVRLNRLINEALGKHRQLLFSTQDAPVQIDEQDTFHDRLLDEVKAALEFARDRS